MADEKTPADKPLEPKTFVVNNGASWASNVIVAACVVGAMLVGQWWGQTPVVPPVPVVDQVPAAPSVTLDPTHYYATKNGRVLPTDEAAKVHSLAVIGDGDYQVVSIAPNAPPVVKSVIVGDPIRPEPVPGPVTPPVVVRPPEPSLPSPVIPTPKVTRAIYVYEKDDTAVPAYVTTALNKINRQGVEAILLEDDTTDGTGRPVHAAVVTKARAVGLPALVVVGSDGAIIRAIKAPTTEGAIMEAIK